MDLDAYFDVARGRMRRTGAYVQGVVPDRPHDPTYAYTAGLSIGQQRHPELIAFSCCVRCVGFVIGGVRRHVEAHGPVEVGDTVELEPDAVVRIEPVLPVWAAYHATFAPVLLDCDPMEVPMLQVVTTDGAGRWPEDPLVNPVLLEDQPLLGSDIPWLTPVAHQPHEDLFFEPATEEHVPLAVPIIDAKGYQGRFELLRAEPEGPGRVRIVDVPWYADHVTAGALVETRPADDIPGAPADCVQLGPVVEEGWAARVFALPPQEVADASSQSVKPLFGLHRDQRHRLSTTEQTLHANTSDPEGFDADIRRFVRDGLLRPIPLYSESPDDEPTDGCVLCDDQEWLP